MSIILDALRRGRARQSSPSAGKAAHTDAVLATLGYSRFSSTSPFHKVRRMLGYVFAGVLLAVVLWATVVFATQNYLFRAPDREISTPVQATRPVLRPTTRPPEPASAPTPLSQPVRIPSRSVTTRPVAPARAATQRDTGFGSVPATSERPAVQTAGHLSVAEKMPPVPTGAPSTTALSPAARASVISRPDDHFALGVYNQRTGNFEEALVHYRAVLQRDELNAEAHNNLGVLYRDKGLLPEAAKELLRAIAINPRYGRAHNNLGVVYLNQKKLDAATAEFREALSLDPANIEAMVNLAVAEREAGRREASRAALTRALELDLKNADAHYNLALIEDEAGNTAAALKHYRAFLQFGTGVHADLMTDVRRRVDALGR